MIPKQRHNNGLRWHKIMPKDREEWLKERELGVGASEVGALLGCSKYSSAYKIWRRKVGLDKPIEENWAMLQGHIFEEHIAKVFEQQFGLEVIGVHALKDSKKDWLAVDNEYDYLRVSPDWIFRQEGKRNEANKRVLECKTSRNHYTPECLQDECLSWWIQCQYQMYVLGYDYAMLGFLCTDNGEMWFTRIDYNKEFTEGNIIPAIKAFWLNNIYPAREYLKKNPKCMMDELEQFAPEIVDAEDMEICFPYEVAGKYIELNDMAESYQELITLKSQKKDIDDRIKQLEGDFKMKMEDAEFVIGFDGKPIITWKANKSSKKFDEQKYKAEHPAEYETYLVEKPGARVFKVK